jgi:adenine-specific DNA-methyltransferase
MDRIRWTISPDYASSQEYLDIGKERIDDARQGKAKYRPHDQPIYDHTKSKLSIVPEEFNQPNEGSEV